MAISLSFSHLTRFARVTHSGSGSVAASAAPLVADAGLNPTQQRLSAGRVAEVQSALSDIDDLFARTSVRRSTGYASAISRNGLGLSNQATATTRNSAAEVNSAATSYTPFGPQFTGSGDSDALPTISGVYDGSDGSDSLLFKVTRAGTHGEDDLRVKVYNSEGDQIKQLKINDNHAEDREYSIGNGLTFSLGAGDLVKNDTFVLDVFDNVGSVVDPDNPFDGARNDRPNFDAGEQVTGGSFEINGITIDVASDDSITSVLGKINTSAAGVAASFDTATERVLLTQKTLGSTPDIALGNDSSGFLSAVKLTGPATPGQDRDADTALAATDRFADVEDGTLTINGVGVSFDVDVDSLNDVVARINGAGTGVTASLVHNEQRLLLKADAGNAPITVADSGSGLAAALQITETTYQPRQRNSAANPNSRELGEAVGRLARSINEIFSERGNVDAADSSLQRLRRDLRSAVSASLRGDEKQSGATGLGLDFSLNDRRGGDFLTVNEARLSRNLQRNPDELRGFFAGGTRDYGAGLNARLRGAVSGYTAAYPGGVDSGLILSSLV